MPFIGVDGLVNGLVCLNIHTNDDSYSNYDFDSNDDSNDDFDSNDDSKYVPVPLTKVHVEARVVNFVSQVTVTQNYINKEKNPIEAIYFFPVEEEAAVIDFTAELEGRTVKTVVKEKVEAKQEYQEAVRDRRTAFLLEETKQDIFQIHVGHLSPGSGCTISITYLSELPVEDGKTRLTVPTTIAPRYVPRDDKSEASGKIASIEYDYKTPANLNFKMETVMKTKIKGIESPSHNVVSKIESEADNNNFFIGETQFEGSTSDMDRDIVVLIKTEEPNQPKIVLEKNEEGTTVGMLSFVPSFELKDITAEIIFLVDCSGSMFGQSINLAKEALHLFLHSLPIDCYFNIVCFGSRFQSLFSESKKYDDNTLDVAKKLADKLSANLGGTEILRPLEHIFNQTSIPRNPRQVFVLTDGAVSNSSQCINCVEKNNDTSRVFTLGIGSSAGRHLVKGMARAGQGTAIFATYGEKIAPKVLKQLKNSLQPCIKKVKINWGDGVQQGNITWQKPVIETTKTLMGYGKPKAGAVGLSEEKSAINNQAPNIVPAIYDGSRLLVYKQFMDGKYPENVTVTADTPDGTLDLVLPIDENNILEGNLVHQMFARKCVQDLEEGDCRTDFLKSKIVELGIKYKLASKYTSFVGVDEKQGKESRVMMTRQIKNQVAHGYGGWGGNLQRHHLTQYGGTRPAGGPMGPGGPMGGPMGPGGPMGGPMGPGGPMGMGPGGPMGMGPGGPMGGPMGPGLMGGPMGPGGPMGMGPGGQMGPGGPMGMGPGGPMGPGRPMGMGPGGPMDMGPGGPMDMGPGGPMRPGGPMGPSPQSMPRQIKNQVAHGYGGWGGNLQSFPGGVGGQQMGGPQMGLGQQMGGQQQMGQMVGGLPRPCGVPGYPGGPAAPDLPGYTGGVPMQGGTIRSFIGGVSMTYGDPIAGGQPGTREREVIWKGELKWQEKLKEGTADQKISHSVNCTVSTSKENGVPEVKPDNWPAKLIMQLIPKSIGLLQTFAMYKRNSKSVLFHPNECESLDALTKVMGTEFVGCVHFTGVQACDIKVLILIYTNDKKAFLGFIPNDQASFAEEIGTVIQQQKRKRSATDLSNYEKLIQLISLQIANGSFKWGDIIEKVSNKSLVDIEAAAAMSGVENDAWLTAVVVMVIETQFDDDKESWEMIVEKAKKWLNKIGNSWDCLFSKVKEFVI